MSSVKDLLTDVLSVFRERYRGVDDTSPGVQAIKAAIASDQPDIAEVRRVLTEDYNLYPHFEARVLALLNDAEAGDVPQAEPAEAEAAPEVSEVDEGEGAAEESSPAPFESSTARPRRTRR